MAYAQRFRFSILALGLAAICSLVQAPNASSQQQSDHLQKAFTVSPGGSLNVENYKGTIHVAAAEGNQVVVDVQKRFEGGSDSDRKWWMENVKINFQNDPTHVNVKVEYPHDDCTFCFGLHDYTAVVELEIHVPRQINVSLDGYKPDVRISGVEGNIAIKSYKSPMLVQETTGSIHIDTYKDTIRLQNIKIRGDLQVKSYKADTEVNARELGQSAELETEKGDITVRVPGNAGLNVDYSGGRRASFHSDFQMAVTSGSGEDVRGTVNGGGTKLRLRTVKGSVTLQRLSGEL